MTIDIIIAGVLSGLLSALLYRPMQIFKGHQNPLLRAIDPVSGGIFVSGAIVYLLVDETVGWTGMLLSGCYLVGAIGRCLLDPQYRSDEAEG